MLLAAGEVAPERDRAEDVVRGEPEHDRGGREGQGRARSAPDDSGRSENCGRDQHRDQAGGVVEADRGLGGRRGEQVDPQLRQRRDQHQRREHDEQAEREDEAREVPEPPAGSGGCDEPPRVGEGGVDDAGGRAADLAVAREEARGAGPVEVRDHDFDCNQGDRGPGHEDRGARQAAPMREGVPGAEPGDHERDLLLRRGREQTEGGERQQPVLVEVPEGEEQQWAGERDGMELVQGQPLGWRVEQVREREAEGRLLRSPGACARASRRAARRAQRRSPGSRAAGRGSARRARAERRRPGSGRSERRAARSDRRAGR